MPGEKLAAAFGGGVVALACWKATTHLLFPRVSPRAFLLTRQGRFPRTHEPEIRDILSNGRQHTMCLDQTITIELRWAVCVDMV